MNWAIQGALKTLYLDLCLLMGPLERSGLGSAAMPMVVAWVFQHTDVDIVVVPPHRRNPAAGRVYEKAGFQWTYPSFSYRGHRVMTVSREQFEQMKGGSA